MSAPVPLPHLGYLPGPDIVCFSHLRWRFVWQRPQHLMTRLARHRRIFVVEEPMMLDEGALPRLDVANLDGVTVLTPRLPRTQLQESGFGARANPAIRNLLAFFLRSRGVSGHATLWYYTPLALGAEPCFLERTRVTVFDAMDELADFGGAPATIRPAMQRMLARASLVLTGGPSLYEAYLDRHPNAHCVPSGVDLRHFASPCPDDPADLRDLRGPVIGYYGVLDERIDFNLIAAVADRNREWSFVLIGPVAKIERATLPKRQNIHYPGKKSYAELPAYLRRFDVAIMPFAQNIATRFISPTKTLEYLAGGAPVVSTPIQDVITLYGDVVEIADGQVAFAAAIERCLASPPDVYSVRKRRALCDRYDWDAIVLRVDGILRDVEDQLGAAPRSEAAQLPAEA
jgi:UDP-galactopyranose mutase